MDTTLEKQIEVYPASMSNNGIFNVAGYRYFVAPIVVTPGRPTERSPHGAVIISASNKKKLGSLTAKTTCNYYNANKFVLNLIFPECC